MDLALLVYGISLLAGITVVIRTLLVLTLLSSMGLGIAVSTWRFDVSEHSYNLNKEGNLQPTIVSMRKFIERVFKVSVIVTILSVILVVLVPNEKTAYIMVGAYATQKIATDPKTIEVGDKVITIINQKLDSYIEDKLKLVNTEKK